MAGRAGKPTRQDRRASVAASTMLILVRSRWRPGWSDRSDDRHRASLQDEADETAWPPPRHLRGKPNRPGRVRGRRRGRRCRMPAADSSHPSGPNAIEVAVRGPQAENRAAEAGSLVYCASLAATARVGRCGGPPSRPRICRRSAAMAAEPLAAAERPNRGQAAFRHTTPQCSAVCTRISAMSRFPVRTNRSGRQGAGWDALAAVDGLLPMRQSPRSIDRARRSHLGATREGRAAVIDRQILKLMPRAMPDPQLRKTAAIGWHISTICRERKEAAKNGYASPCGSCSAADGSSQAVYVSLSQHSRHCPGTEQVGGVRCGSPGLNRCTGARIGRGDLLLASGTAATASGGEGPRGNCLADWPAGAASVRQAATSDYGSQLPPSGCNRRA